METDKTKKPQFNVKEMISQIKSFEDFIYNRGEELLRAQGKLDKTQVYRNGIDYDPKVITINFQENTRHDCPDHYYADIQVFELEYSEDKWNWYIQEITLTTAKKSQEAEELKLERQRQKDLQDLKNLQDKLFKR